MSFLSYFIFFLLLPQASTQKPGCPTRCGEVSIPYPFGVGTGCSHEKSFNITCISSKPYLNVSNTTVEVVEINPTQIRIKYPHILFGACFERSTGNLTWSDRKEINMSETQYSLSEDNWLTGIGCSDLVVSSSFAGNTNLMDACLGYCSDLVGSNTTSLGYCPNNGDRNSAGVGCCRSPIPKGTLL